MTTMKNSFVRLVPVLYCGVLVSGAVDNCFQVETEITLSSLTSATCSGDAPRWNLEEHFPLLRKNVTNDVEDAILDSLEERAATFAQQYRGALDRSLGEALEEYEKIDEDLDMLVVYWSLKTSQNLGDDTLRRKRSSVDARASRIRANHLGFLVHEIAQMRSETLEQLFSTDERVRWFYSFVDKIRAQGQFLLDETIEKALDIRAPWTSPDIVVKAYRKQLSSSTFRIAGEPDVFSYTQIRELMRSENQETRHLGQQAIKDGIIENRIDKFAALALNMVVGSWSIETRERGYPSPRSRRNALNRISDEIVNALIAAVKKEGVELTRRAMLLKKRLLISTGKLKTFSFVDRLAPLTLNNDLATDANARIPWCQAVKTVKEGYASFSPVFVRLFGKLLKEGRIDAAPAEGKQTGAFCSGGTPATGPFILMTHTGVKANVQTLAHEAGHAIHFLLAYDKGNLQYHPPLPLAETASLMGETIVFYHLLDQTDSPQRVLEMLIEHVDSLIGTIIRQVSFDRFEELVHEARISGIVGDDSFDQMWLQSTKEFFGDEGDVFDDYAGVEKDWSTVHHFTKAPFYVYSYALADLLVGSLLAARTKNTGSYFEETFISFLQAGDTADLETALRPFGLDPKTPSFWEEAIGVRLGTAIDRAERIAVELGYIEDPRY